jgi:peptide chain release factor 2
MSQGLEDVSGLLELAVEADDEETFNEAVAELDVLEEKLAQLEFRRMFSGEYDSADCYLDIQAGSGGTEAQDWASMLTRMYLRWAEALTPDGGWCVQTPLAQRAFQNQRDIC